MRLPLLMKYSIRDSLYFEHGLKDEPVQGWEISGRPPAFSCLLYLEEMTVEPWNYNLNDFLPNLLEYLPNFPLKWICFWRRKDQPNLENQLHLAANSYDCTTVHRTKASTVVMTPENFHSINHFHHRRMGCFWTTIPTPPSLQHPKQQNTYAQ